MEEMLRGFLPVLFPQWTEGVHWRCIPHEGKSDLRKSLPRKLRAWQQPGARFVVLHDQDSSDCETLKASLRDICKQAGRPDTLIRIPCRELEAWYLGNLAAVDAGLGTRNLAGLQNKRKYRNPDRLHKPSQELAKIAGKYQKRAGSRAISPHLDPERNRSRSFRVFVGGLQAYAASEGTT